MIPAFKKLAGAPMPREYKKFNDLLSRPRVKSEHCIGVLKARFQQLKNLRNLINSKAAMKEVIDTVTAAVILHNLLIAHPCPEEWIDEEFLDLDDDDELNKEMPWLAPHGTRREIILAWFEEEGDPGLKKRATSTDIYIYMY